MQLPTDQTILSGLQPSGHLHIGNYLGALKQWIALQENNTTYYCIVDLHAITVPYDPDQLQSHIFDTAAMYLATGLDPSQSTLFIQSHVPAHAQLAWLLGTTTPLGELQRMTQFKEKDTQSASKSTLGLFSYPVLQAADILLYQTNVVPVGEDQIQHLELTRDIAKRFNNKFSEVFTVPQPLVNKDTARIMSLTDPDQKMSKSSDSPKSFIALSDDPNAIKQKISSAVTGTEAIFSFTESDAAVQNLLRIYQGFSGQAPAEIEANFDGKSYQEFKSELADLLIETLSPIRDKYQELRQDEAMLSHTLADGAKQASQVANKTLSQVKSKMGLL